MMLSPRRCRLFLCLTSLLLCMQCLPVLAAGQSRSASLPSARAQGEGRASRFLKPRPPVRVALLPVQPEGETARRLTLLLAERLRDISAIAVSTSEQTRTRFGADWALRFEIKQENPLIVEGHATVTSNGKLAGRFYSRAENADIAAGEIADQLSDVAGTHGAVGVIPGDNLARITLGTLHRFRPRGEVVFYEADEILGYGDTLEVDDATSLVRIRPGADYSSIHIGTRVRVLYNPPPYEAGLTVRQIEKKKERREDIHFAIAAAIALAAAYTIRAAVKD